MWSDNGLWFTPASPTYDELGRNSEKQSICACVGGSEAGGQVPLSAFVLLSRICCRSGNTRGGSVLAAFSPGELYCSESSSLTSAARPNCRKSGPSSFVLS